MNAVQGKSEAVCAGHALASILVSILASVVRQVCGMITKGGQDFILICWCYGAVPSSESDSCASESVSPSYCIHKILYINIIVRAEGSTTTLTQQVSEGQDCTDDS